MPLLRLSASMLTVLFIWWASVCPSLQAAPESAHSGYRESYAGAYGDWISYLSLDRRGGFSFFHHRVNGSWDQQFGDQGVVYIDKNDPKFGLQGVNTLFLHDVMLNLVHGSLIFAFTASSQQKNSQNQDLLIPFDPTVMGNSAVRSELILIKYDAHGQKLDESFGQKGVARFPVYLNNSNVRLKLFENLDRTHYAVALGGLAQRSHASFVLSLDAQGKREEGFADKGVLLLSHSNIGGLDLTHVQVTPNKELLFDAQTLLAAPPGKIAHKFFTVDVNAKGALTKKKFADLTQKSSFDRHQYLLDRSTGGIYFFGGRVIHRDEGDGVLERIDLGKMTVERLFPGEGKLDSSFRAFTFDCPADSCDITWKDGRHFILQKRTWDWENERMDHTAETVHLGDDGVPVGGRLDRLELGPCLEALAKVQAAKQSR